MNSVLHRRVGESKPIRALWLVFATFQNVTDVRIHVIKQKHCGFDLDWGKPRLAILLGSICHMLISLLFGLPESHLGDDVCCTPALPSISKFQLCFRGQTISSGCLRETHFTPLMKHAWDPLDLLIFFWIFNPLFVEFLAEMMRSLSLCFNRVVCFSQRLMQSIVIWSGVKPLRRCKYLLGGFV